MASLASLAGGKKRKYRPGTKFAKELEVRDVFVGDDGARYLVMFCNSVPDDHLVSLWVRRIDDGRGLTLTLTRHEVVAIDATSRGARRAKRRMLKEENSFFGVYRSTDVSTRIDMRDGPLTQEAIEAAMRRMQDAQMVPYFNTWIKL